MMNSMTEADWNQMMESFNSNGWQTGMEHVPQETMGGRM